MILMAKKIIEAVKKTARKAVVKKKVATKVVKIVPQTCSECKGRGLKDPHTLCSPCSGSGTI
jgi:DnaJ-class molecular chaperone